MKTFIPIVLIPSLIGIAYFLIQWVIHRFVKEWSFHKASLLPAGLCLVIFVIFIYQRIVDAQSYATLGFMILWLMTVFINVSYWLCVLLHKLFWKKKIKKS